MDAQISPDIALVTVLYKNEEGLPGFLKCLASQTLRTWKLIAINNGLPENSLRLVSSLGDRATIVQNNSNVGFSRAANQGLRAALDAKARFIILINNDTVFGADFLRDLLAAWERLRAPVIAPRIMSLRDPSHSWYAGGHFDNGWIFRNIHEDHDPNDTREHRQVEFASGCCLGFDPEALESIGLFDERYFVYWEDTDLCFRLRKAGTPIYYVQHPHLLHEGGASSGGERTRNFNRLYYRSYAQFLRKHFGLGCAIKTLARLLSQEASREHRSAKHATLLARAMLSGAFSAPSRTAAGTTRPG